MAQPTITSLGSGTPYCVSNLTGGNYYVSGSGIVTTAVGRWVFNPGSSTITTSELGGAVGAYAGMSSDGAYQLGIFPNASPQIFGNTATGVTPAFSTTPTLSASTTQPSATETIINRWSSSTSTWARLAMLPTDTGLCYGQPSGGVNMMTFGPGSSSGGTFLDGNAISQNGRFVVGHGYISSYNSAAGTTIAASTSRWHPFIWDASTNTTTVLQTPARTSSNTYRPRTGRAFAVSNDGQVVVGYQEHNSSSSAAADPDGARPIVWRWNTGTNHYDMSYLPTANPLLADTPGVYYVCCNGATCTTVTSPSLCGGTVVYGGNGYMSCTSTPLPCSATMVTCCNGEACTVVASGSCAGTNAYLATPTCTPSPCRQVLTASATAGSIFINAAGTTIVGRNIDNSGGPYICKWTWNSGTSSWDTTNIGTNVGAKSTVDTVTCPSGTPTVTTTGAHGLNVGDLFYLQGTTTAAYNGMWKVSNVTSTTSFEFSAPDDSPASCATDATGGSVYKAASWLPASVYLGCGAASNWGAPPSLSVTGMSDDGNTIVGTATYSTCGSFMTGGWIWHAADNTLRDWYDYCVSQNVPGVTTYYAPIDANNQPTNIGLPRLGNPTGINADGTAIVGRQGGTQIVLPSAGPWIYVANGGATCVAPQFTVQPAASVSYSLCSSIGVILNVAASGTGPLSFQWYRDSGGGPVAVSDGATGYGSTISGSASVQLRITYPRALDAGTYTCVVTGCNSQTATSSAAVVAPDSTQVTPANNDCATATAVGEGTFNWNICAAWANQGSSCVTDLASVWYRYTPTFTGNARFQTCASTFDTTITLYDQCNGSQLANGCNDDVGSRGLAGVGSSCSATRSVVSSFPVTSGVPIYVRVGAKSFPFSTTNSATSGALVISQAPPPPANDTCDHATVVSGNSVTAFNLSEATDDFNIGVSADGSTSFCTPGTSQTATSSNRDIWFILNSPCGGTYTIDTCGSTMTNPMLHVFDNCGSFNLIACNDNVGSGVSGCTSQQARISNLTISGPVLIRVSQSGTGSPGTAGTSGSGNLNISGTDVPCGVCCRGATCNATITSAASCTAGGSAGAFFATTAGAPACNTGGSTSTPCCYPDYDKVNGIQVADIFAFLNDWFASSPYAQVGGDGTSSVLAVADIFAFLNAWFAGCP
jgi:hypothetical protein